MPETVKVLTPWVMVPAPLLPSPHTMVCDPYATPLNVAMKRIMGGRDAIKYYEAGMDLGLSEDIEESFRIFQARIIEAYEKMVDEFGLVPIDATRSIEEQQAEVRKIVSNALTGTKRARVRRWLDLASLAKASQG